MELREAIKLIEKGVEQSSSTPQQWADLGAGEGIFSSALSTLLPSRNIIFAVDTNAKSLSRIAPWPKHVELIKIQEDFTSTEFTIDQLDGVIMANSLHFVLEQKSFLMNLKSRLKTNAHVIIIEYDMKSPNTFVPYPIPFDALEALLTEVGFTSVRKIGERKSLYNSSLMYSIVARLH